MEQRSGDYVVTDDVARLDRDAVYDWLATESYWATGRSRAAFDRSIEHSLVFSLRHVGGAVETQAGFARLVTDRATFAWLADVLVLPDHRGRGLGKLLVASTLAHPEVVDVPRWMLGTHDAHTLYEQFGYRLHPNPERMMTIDLRPAAPS